ncbi:MAG: hypothetical protein ACI8TP_003499 [Acidimicrobiales bacterium]|jgi:hypothetical protein
MPSSATPDEAVRWFGDVDDERIEMLRAAIAVCPSGPDGALLHAILSIEMADGADDSLETTAAHALVLALDTGDDRVTARVVRLAESALRRPDTLERRADWLRQGVAAAERAGDPLLRGLLSMSHHEIPLEEGNRGAMAAPLSASGRVESSRVESSRVSV